MKDYFDLWILVCHTEFEGDILRQAIQATFERRKTALTGQLPLGLTEAFAKDTQKRKQWQSFLMKNRLEALTLDTVVAALADFMLPIIEAASAGNTLLCRWQAGGPWLPTSIS